MPGPNTSRRAILAGGSFASIAALAPAKAHPRGTVLPAGCPEFRAALDSSGEANCRFNNLPANLEQTDEAQHQRELSLLITASRRADRAVPTNWQEYTRLIDHMTDDGCSGIDEDNARRLLAHARRLAAQVS